MRLLLVALLLLGGPAQAQDAAFDALAEFFTLDAPTDEAAAKAIPERGEKLSRLTADLALAAQGLESFRSPDDTTKALKYAPERVPAELRPMFSSRERALDTLYRTLAVADYTWATRFPGEKCSAIDRRSRLLFSPDGLFKDPKTGQASPWLVHLLGPEASQNAEAALDNAAKSEPAKGRDYELLRAKVAKIAAALAAAPKEMAAQEGGADDEAMGQPADPGEDPPDESKEGLRKPSADNPELKRVISRQFQPTDRYPGGTAGAIRHERVTGNLLSPAGHEQKGRDIVRWLDKILKNQNLSHRDRATAEALRDDLLNALVTPRGG